MVADILPDKLVEVLADDEAFIANAIDDAGDENDIVLSAFAVLGVEDNLYDFLGNAEQFNALIDQTLLEEGGELFNFTELPAFPLEPL